jgi:hypothetical protein
VRVSVFDPRQGADWRCRVPGSLAPFSSVEQHVFVVDAVGFDWQSHASWLDHALSADATDLVVLFDPWYPRRRTKTGAFLSAFPQVMQAGALLVAVAAERSRGVVDTLRLRSELGGDAGGLWCMVATHSPEAVMALFGSRLLSGSPVGWVLPVMSSIAGALCLDELQHSTLLLRLGPDVEALVDDHLPSLLRTPCSGGR